LSLKYVLLATEGAHDQAAICKFLQLFGLQSFRGERKLLDEFWLGLLKTEKKSENIYAHEDMHQPRFFTSQTHSVAVYQGSGSNLSQNLFDLLNDMRIDVQQLHAFGLIVDADNNSPDKVAKEYADKFRRFFPSISVRPGKVVVNSSRTGIFVLPDNSRTGTLDTFLVDCASVAYPDHKSGAMQFLDGLDDAHKAHWDPFDSDKAVVATIVSVVQPGIANTISIRRDQWISAETISGLPQVANLSNFLKDLLELQEN